MRAYATEATARSGLHAVLRSLAHPAPLAIGPGTTIRTALQEMNARGAEVAVVVDTDSQVPLGIVTLRDIVDLIVRDECDLGQPVVAVMTGGWPSLPADATVQQATVMMVRRGLRYLLLVEPDGRLNGLLAQGELYGLQAAGSEQIVRAVLSARSVEELAERARQVREFTARRLAEGVGAEALCQWISALNDLVTIQAIDLLEGRMEPPIVPWCWLVFGSEGRLEQTLVTDQDNGIVFEAESAAEAEDLRRAFVPFAQAVNRALDACGFPLCKGEIMAGNPAWCLSLDEWKRTFARWMAAAAPKALLNSTIFFDFRPLYGRDDLALGLRAWLLGRIADKAPFLRAMAANALEDEPPLGVLRPFRVARNPDYPHTLDLKVQGIRFFTDAARILALGNHVADTNTVERLRSAAPAIGMPLEETAALVEAFYQIQRLRLRNQVAAEYPDAANRMNPAKLHELDRHILKEAFRQARRLQQRIRMDYRL
jgi:CBS domain-containing protein